MSSCCKLFLPRGAACPSCDALFWQVSLGVQLSLSRLTCGCRQDAECESMCECKARGSFCCSGQGVCPLRGNPQSPGWGTGGGRGGEVSCGTVQHVMRALRVDVRLSRGGFKLDGRSLASQRRLTCMIKAVCVPSEICSRVRHSGVGHCPHRLHKGNVPNDLPAADAFAVQRGD